MTESEIKQRLDKAQRLIAELTTNLHKTEAIRDSLILRLADNEGLHDKQHCAVR